MRITPDKKLKALIERIERLKENQKAIATDIKEVFSEAKAGGFCPKVMRLLIRQRAMPADLLEEQQELLDTYAAAMEWDSTPLAKAAARDGQKSKASSGDAAVPAAA